MFIVDIDHGCNNKTTLLNSFSYLRFPNLGTDRTSLVTYFCPLGLRTSTLVTI